MRTDGVHCREFAGTGPVNLQGSSKQVLPWQVTMGQFMCASISHTHCWCKVGMLKVPAICTCAAERLDEKACRLHPTMPARMCNAHCWEEACMA